MRQKKEESPKDLIPNEAQHRRVAPQSTAPHKTGTKIDLFSARIHNEAWCSCSFIHPQQWASHQRVQLNTSLRFYSMESQVRQQNCIYFTNWSDSAFIHAPQSLRVSVQRILFHLQEPCQLARYLLRGFAQSSKQPPLQWYLNTSESAAANTLLILLSN